MGKVFSEKELEFLSEFATLRSEHYIEDRKGISQTKYIIEVSDGVNWAGESVPRDLIGLWMQDHQDDNTSISWFERLGTNDKYGYYCSWVKCREIEVITVDYVEED